MTKIIKISLLVFITLFYGCEDYLEVDPIGKASTDSYPESQEDVFKSLVGVYNIIQYSNANGAWNSIYFIKNLPGDDCLAAGGSPTDQAEYQYIDDFNIDPENSKLEAAWNNLYKIVNASNTVVNRINDIEDPSDGLIQMKGEAQALRAYAYFEIAVLYGGGPLFTINPVSAEETHQPRASLTEIYAQIENDFTDAIDVLPLKSEYSAADKFRFSKGTAQGFLGKAYLYQEKYDEAAIVFENLINSAEYDLEPNFTDIWTKEHEFGIESLFEASYGGDISYDWGNFPWDNYTEANIEVQLQGPRNATFDLANSSLEVINGWGFNNPSAKIGDLFLEEGETVRYEGTLISADDFIATDGSIVDPNSHDYEGFMRLKYATKPSESSEAGVTDLNYGTNWRILRYADVLLMAAEAYNKTGQDIKAQAEIERVRARAGFTDPVTATGDNLFNLIVKERQIELAFEGVRYWDLVRWGKAQEELSGLGYDSHYQIFPVPKNEIITNNAISETDQNPGY